MVGGGLMSHYDRCGCLQGEKNLGLANVAACVYNEKEKERRTLIYKSDDGGLKCAHTHCRLYTKCVCVC